MIVPTTKGLPTGPDGTPQQMPSQTNLLMALAEMHKQGQFAPPDPQSNVVSMKRPK